ncbi:MAG: U32 family peptidase [Candidatus Omnitrophica bacterium]|nr:U32 family peptidase [Candidatus Omnitrophota bacterium]
MKPELLSPAGDWPSLQTAIASGADAVYFGIKGLNMRYHADNFEALEMKKIMALLHDNNKKGYLALNTIIYNTEIDKIRKILEQAQKAGVDAVILWDMAVLSLAKEIGLDIHLSTQASVANFPAIKYYASLGVKRIVLARECSLSDIRAIIKKIDQEKLDIQIETFIHGALCVSLSGRCFLSQHSFLKSANRGECLQPCRREYRITDVDDARHQYILGQDYILSPQDLCTIDFIDKLIEAGISAFKIEGRMRSPEYIKEVTSTYCQAIDAYIKGGLDVKLKKDLRQHLELAYNRGLGQGFFLESAEDLGSRIGASAYEKIFLGQVVNFYKKVNVAALKIKNAQIKKGDRILVYGKNTPAQIFKVDDIQIDNKSVEQAEKGETAGLKLPFKARRNDKVFLFNLKE